MARTINKVELLGRVGTDPEMKYTPNGTAVVQLRLATERRRQDGETEADWHNVVVWSKQAEAVNEYVGRHGARGRLQAVRVPHETIGTWTTKIARLPVSGGWHALVYTKTAEYGFEKDSFLLLAQTEEDASAHHHRFLDKRSPLPLHGSWADWLWRRGLDEGEIVPLQSVGVSASTPAPGAGSPSSPANPPCRPPR